MKKILLPVILFSLINLGIIYAQKNITHQSTIALYEKASAEFLRKAPASVQEYYRAFDSLAHPTWTGWVHEKWSLKELKRYASLIYDANAYDPIVKYRNDIAVGKTAKEQNLGPVTDSHDVIREVRNRISRKHAELILNAYWLTINVEDVTISNYVDRGTIKPTISKKITVQGRITKIWKGDNLQVGNIIKPYYYPGWGGRGLKKGNSYIIAIYPLVDIDNIPELALGGPETLQSSVYPIENGFIIDADNIFGLGNKVDINKFFAALQASINEIKSWKEGAR